MSDLAAVAAGTEQQPPARDDSAADADLAGHVDEIGHSGVPADPVLGNDAQIGVIADDDRSLPEGQQLTQP